MNAYVITGPESLIHAAFKETFVALGKGALLENTGVCPYNSLFFNCAGSYWLSVGINNLNFQHHLALPADWDKFMGILAELKKPKLPTTSQGIPYLRQGQQVFYGPSENSGILTVGNLRHLLKQGVTELVTKAGRLTQADLELLTK